MGVKSTGMVTFSSFSVSSAWSPLVFLALGLAVFLVEAFLGLEGFPAEGAILGGKPLSTRIQVGIFDDVWLKEGRREGKMKRKESLIEAGEVPL